MDAKKLSKTALIKEVRSLRRQVRYLNTLNKQKTFELNRRDAASVEYKKLEFPCVLWFHRYVEWVYKQDIPFEEYWETFWIRNEGARDLFWNERLADKLSACLDDFAAFVDSKHDVD